jgi:hypothetical protein
VLVPALVSTTVNTIALAVGAAGLLLYGGTRLLPVSGAGVLLVLLELETVWNKQHLAVEIAAAASGLALLAAFELGSWSQQIAETPIDPGAYRAQARMLASSLGLVAVPLALLVLAARGIGHGPALGVAGGLAAVGVGVGLLRLAAPAGARINGDRGPRPPASGALALLHARA